MAHKIDHSTGQPAFIAYQAPGWHNLGKTFQQDITVENALYDAKLAFKVSKAANIHRIGTIETLSTRSFFLYREDTKGILAEHVGKNYTVYQNDQALAVVDEMLKTGKVKIETAGAVDNGRRVFVLLKLQNPIVVNGNDEILQYVLLANGHDGKLTIIAMPTNIRVVCWNTLSAALAGAQAEHKIRHTAKADERVKEAFKIMGLLEESTKANTAAYNAMTYNSLTQQEFFNYIGNIFMDAEDINELQKGNKDALTAQKKTIISGVLQYAENGPGQKLALGNNLNMWYAYNAVTGYITSDQYKNADARFNSLLFGDASKKIRLAGELALAPHEIRPLKATASSTVNLN